MLHEAYLSEVSSRPTEVRELHRANVFVVGEVATFRLLASLSDAHEIKVEHYSFAEHFLAADQPQKAGCVLIDIVPDARMGLPLLQNLKSSAGRFSAILLADRLDVRLAVEAIKSGADNVLERPVDERLLISSVLAVIEASQPAPSMTLFPHKDREAAQAGWSALTARQREILDRIILGQPNKIMAADLGISQRTAENHRAALMKKMGASSVSDLIQIAMSIS